MMKRAKRGCPALETLEGRTLLTAGALDTTFGGTGIVTHDFGSNTTAPAGGRHPAMGRQGRHRPQREFGRFRAGPLQARRLARHHLRQGGLAIAPFSGGGQYLAAVAVDPTTHDVYAVGSGPGGKTVAVARFTPAGALDSTFGKGGEVTVAASKPYLYNAGTAAAVDSSGRLVVAGNTTTYDTTNYFYPSVGVVFRFTTTGALDKTFNGSGEVVAPYFDDNDGWNALQLEPSGSSYQIAVAGVYDHNNTLAVYNANGTPVTSIGSNGVAVLNANNPDDGYLFQFQPDGRLIELQSGGTGETWTLNRYNADGTSDATFGTGGQVSMTTSTLPPRYGPQLHRRRPRRADRAGRRGPTRDQRLYDLRRVARPAHPDRRHRHHLRYRRPGYPGDRIDWERLLRAGRLPGGHVPRRRDPCRGLRRNRPGAFTVFRSGLGSLPERLEYERGRRRRDRRGRGHSPGRSDPAVAHGRFRPPHLAPAQELAQGLIDELTGRPPPCASDGRPVLVMKT